MSKLYILMCMLIISCTPKKNNQDKEVISLNLNYDSIPNILLSSSIFKSNNFIALDDNNGKDIIAEISSLDVTNEHFIITDLKQNKIFIFNRNGRINSVIYNIGKRTW